MKSILSIFRKRKMRKSDKQLESSYVATPDFSKQIISLSDELSDILIHKNLGKYLKNDYVLPCNILHYWYSDHQLREMLVPIMKAILTYLELPKIVDLHIEFKDKNASTAGKYYTKNFYSKAISLYIDARQSGDSVLAALCHECTHYFMEYHGLQIADENENEIRTDIYANLIGFNLIMKRGYEPCNNIKIGYISSDSCSDIYNYLTYKRKILNVIVEIKKNASVAEVLYEQVMLLYNSIPHSKQSKSALKLTFSFQKFIIKDIPNIINDCKTVHTKTKIANMIIEANDTLCVLCTDISKYIHEFQSDKYK